MGSKFINILTIAFILITYTLNAEDEISNNIQTNENKDTSEIEAIENIDNDYKYSLENSNNMTQNMESNVENNENKSLIDNVYGHIGFFGKSNALNKDYKDDNYTVFSGSVGLKYLFDNDISSKISLNLGIYIMTDLYKNTSSNKYVESKFVTHNAFLRIKDAFYELKMGRYKANRDWIKHYVQGVSINATYSWFNFWGEWVGDQAYVTRESLSDFNIFRNNYNKEWLIATGIDTDFYGVNISPYYYFLNKNFWTAGIKLGFKTDIADGWGSKTFIHYAYLESKTSGKYGHTNNTPIKNGTSSIIWLDQEINYRLNKNGVNSNLLFGLGFIKILDDEFELAKIGNVSRFETGDYRSYSVIETGGLNNGYNSSNAFYGNTTTIYGFAGFRVNDISVMLLGRDSRGNKNMQIKQQAYSIGGKYKIINGFYIGGLAAYMTENDKNKSFMKAYLEFII